MNLSIKDLSGLILAGGRASRMGGCDKGLVLLAGKPMIKYIVELLQPQVQEILISANRNQQEYSKLGTVVPDAHPGFMGPLAGMHSGMAAASTQAILTVPCDAPLLPKDFVARMLSGLNQSAAELAVAHDGQRLQPVFTLIPNDLLDSIAGFLATGERKIDRWFAQHKVATIDFSDCPDAFININTDHERLALEAQLQL